MSPPVWRRGIASLTEADARLELVALVKARVLPPSDSQQ